MKGDKVTIRLNTGMGTEAYTVEATKSGRSIEIEEPGKNERMLKVIIKGRTGKPAETHQFDWGSVIAIIDGRKETEET